MKRRAGSEAGLPKVQMMSENHTDVKTPMARQDSATNLSSQTPDMMMRFVKAFNKKNPDQQVTFKIDPNGGGLLMQAKNSTLTE